jgi:hypothetical protein
MYLEEIDKAVRMSRTFDGSAMIGGDPFWGSNGRWCWQWVEGVEDPARPQVVFEHLHVTVPVVPFPVIYGEDDAYYVTVERVALTDKNLTQIKIEWRDDPYAGREEPATISSREQMARVLAAAALAAVTGHWAIIGAGAIIGVTTDPLGVLTEEPLDRTRFIPITTEEFENFGDDGWGQNEYGPTYQEIVRRPRYRGESFVGLVPDRAATTTT